MNFINKNNAVSFRLAIILLPLMITISSCLKNQDNTPSGPKSGMRITNIVWNAAPFEVFFNEANITSNPLPYGMSTGSVTDPYIRLSSGTHNIKVRIAGSIIYERTIYLEANKNYSLFFYDSLKNNQVKALLLADHITPIDTLAKARFLHFIPGTDTLSASLIKNNQVPPVNKKIYVGTQSDPAADTTFNLILQPGIYTLRLMKGTSMMYEQTSLDIQAGKLYSFLATGLTGGSGIFKESIVTLKHN